MQRLKPIDCVDKVSLDVINVNKAFSFSSNVFLHKHQTNTHDEIWKKEMKASISKVDEIIVPTSYVYIGT